MLLSMKKQWFIGFAICLFVGLFGTLGQASDLHERHFSAYHTHKACKYFDGISFRERHSAKAETIRVRIADTCADALKTPKIVPETAELASVSKSYLQDLSLLHRALVDISMDRYNRSKASKGKATSMVRPISHMGFYLIASHMGVLSQSTEFERAYKAALYPTFDAAQSAIADAVD
ncbi:MAG: hypothetical protein AAF826_03710 [Pseudomonadota bacterium]